MDDQNNNRTPEQEYKMLIVTAIKQTLGEYNLYLRDRLKHTQSRALYSWQSNLFSLFNMVRGKLKNRKEEHFKRVYEIFDKHEKAGKKFSREEAILCQNILMDFLSEEGITWNTNNKGLNF